MAEMVDLKRTAADIKKQEKSVMNYSESEYNTNIYLGNLELEKLGIKTADIGQEMTITAKVRVASFSEYSTQNHENRSMTLEVMEMGMAPAKEEKSAAQTLYGEKKE